MGILDWIFFFSISLLAYTYALYPFLMYQLARRYGRKTSLAHIPPKTALPNVTVVLAACDAECLIEQRLRNLLESNYPIAKLDIIVVSDGSHDRTVEIARTICPERVTVLEKTKREGKMGALNLGVPAASGEIIVLTDVRQQFAPTAIRHLVAPFTDPSVGAVSGNLDIAKSSGGSGAGVDVYWRIERFLRLQESHYHAAVGCTGAIYAIRKSLFGPPPVDTILDDVVIPMSVAVQGYRVLFESEALAWDPQPLDPETERRRKRRTIAGAFQMLCRYPQWLLPWHNPIWWQLLSHKYLRLLGPFLLLLTLGLNVILVPTSQLFLLSLGVQIICYTLATIGLLCPKISWKPISLCAGFLFLNVRVIPGFISYIRRDYAKGWQQQTSDDSMTS